MKVTATFSYNTGIAFTGSYLLVVLSMLAAVLAAVLC
jgi:hypothetical protein